MVPLFKAVLVIDPDEFFRKGVEKLIKRRNVFNEVFSANTIEEAERILETHDITHLVCDYNVGPTVPNGTYLIQQLRNKYPSISRALIFTTHNLDATNRPHGVDRIISKNRSVSELIADLTE